MTHPLLTTDREENGVTFYEPMTVKIGPPSAHNPQRQRTLICDEDSEFLQGPQGNAFWAFFADNIPDRNAVIRVKLTTKRTTGTGWYQDVADWRPLTTEEREERGEDSSTPMNGRSDATGISIERQVAFKGMVALATGYADHVAGEALRLTAIAMAGQLWHDSLPIPPAEDWGHEPEPDEVVA